MINIYEYWNLIRVIHNIIPVITDVTLLVVGFILSLFAIIHMSKGKKRFDNTHKLITGTAALSVIYNNIIKSSSGGNDNNKKDEDKDDKDKKDKDKKDSTKSSDNSSNSTSPQTGGSQ